MKNIGLVVPKFNNEIQTRYSFPVGLAYIKGALRAAGYEVLSINLNNISTNDLENELRIWLEEKRINICLSGGYLQIFSV